MTTDRERLIALLDALDASSRFLERPVCRGWTGDWQITGKHGHVLSDGDSFLIYVTTPERDVLDPDGKCRCYGSPRRLASIKKALGFARLVQDGDDEGIFRLDRLPNEAEAEAIRNAMEVRKRRHMTEEQIERSRSLLASARPLFNRGSYAAGSI